MYSTTPTAPGMWILGGIGWSWLRSARTWGLRRLIRERPRGHAEVGGPLEHLNGKDSNFPIDGFIKYNFQNEVTASWLMHASPSFSVNGWYTLKGPVDPEFAAPAPACPTVK
jgi:hypothetical protein